MTRRYTKNDVAYDVDKLSPEGISHFEVLVAAKRKVEEASLDLALARASVITLVSGLDKYLTEEAALDPDSVGNI
tara:strand:+ start:2168 stop:2392 length:225 start_codon:yes stop_codon:yes gene_type:complete